MVKARSYLFLMIFIQLWVVALNAQNESYQITIPVASNTIQLDGILDDEEWQSASQADDFWLQDPIDGIKASLETIVRIQADEKNLYVAAICMDDNGMIAQTLKRDQFSGSDAFGVFIDPVAEQTNGNGFIVTAHNAQTEMSLSPDEEDESWDNRWYSATKRYVDRWVVEIAIPLKTLRYKSDNDRWHINFARAEPGRNEVHVWAPVPRQFAPADLGYYGTAIWDIQPKKSKNNISAIPYIRASLDQSSVGEKTTTTNTDVGMDGKIAITPSLNLDLTYNPDFSQVEVDVQVTNLTRFQYLLS